MSVQYFGGNTKLRELSNLYECEIHYNDRVYPSVEHAYAAAEYIEKDKFSTGGEFSTYEALLNFYKSAAKVDYWRRKKCIGIVAKLAKNAPEKSKLTFIDGTDTERVVYELLCIKFSTDTFKQILLSTKSNVLVELDRQCKKKFDKGVIDKWGGIAYNGKIYGGNLMGVLLMRIRDVYNN